MTRDEEIWHERRRELLQMIREAGISTGGHPMNPLEAYAEQFERFAELVAKAEREACAKVCDNYDIRAKTSDGWIILTEAQRVSSELATKIRARSEV